MIVVIIIIAYTNNKGEKLKYKPHVICKKLDRTHHVLPFNSLKLIFSVQKSSKFSHGRPITKKLSNNIFYVLNKVHA